MNIENQPKTKGKRQKKAKQADQIRPDPSFKSVIGEAAVAMGLELRNVEIPQITITDLVIGVPDKTKLPGTMFEFFNDINFVEFKSEGDKFTDSELSDALGRIHLFYAKDGTFTYKQILGVFVCSHYPEFVVEWLTEQEILPLESEHDWLLRYRIGLVRVAIVVCRSLPMQERFYRFLMFAPVTSPNWKDFVKIAIENELKEFVNLLTRLKPLEVSMVIEERKREGQLTPTQIETYEKAGENILKFVRSLPLERQLNFLNNVYTSEEVAAIVQGLSKKLTPQQRLAGLSPEELDKMATLIEKLRAEKK